MSCPTTPITTTDLLVTVLPSVLAFLHTHEWVGLVLGLSSTIHRRLTGPAAAAHQPKAINSSATSPRWRRLCNTDRILDLRERSTLIGRYSTATSPANVSVSGAAASFGPSTDAVLRFVARYRWLVCGSYTVVIDSWWDATAVRVLSAARRLVICVHPTNGQPIAWAAIGQLRALADMSLYYADQQSVPLRNLMDGSSSSSDSRVVEFISSETDDTNDDTGITMHSGASTSGDDADDNTTPGSSACDPCDPLVEGVQLHLPIPAAGARECAVYDQFQLALIYYQASARLRRLLSTLIVHYLFHGPFHDSPACWELITSFHQVRHLLVSAVPRPQELTHLPSMSRLETFVHPAALDWPDTRWSVPASLINLRVLGTTPYGTAFDAHELLQHLPVFTRLQYLTVRQIGVGFGPRLMQAISACRLLRYLTLQCYGNDYQLIHDSQGSMMERSPQWDEWDAEGWEDEANTWSHLRLPALVSLRIASRSPHRAVLLHHIIQPDSFASLEQLNLSGSGGLFSRRLRPAHFLLLFRATHLRLGIRQLTLTADVCLLYPMKCKERDWQAALRALQAWPHLNFVCFVFNCLYHFGTGRASQRLTDMRRALPRCRVHKQRVLDMCDPVLTAVLHG